MVQILQARLDVKRVVVEAEKRPPHIVSNQRLEIPTNHLPANVSAFSTILNEQLELIILVQTLFSQFNRGFGCRVI